VTTFGSGLGGAVVIAPQNTYGGSPVFTSGRTLGTFKSFKSTYNQHPVQGGPYLRNGELVDIGSARVLIYLDAKATIIGDVANIGQALLVASAFGSSATLTAIGTTTAFALGGVGGFTISAPDLNNTFIDLQALVPTAAGTQIAETYHSGYITKATYVFDRLGLVSYEYEVDFQFLEKATGAATVSEPAAPIPFSMANASALFKVGAVGSEANVTGVKKCTIVIDRKVADARIYNGAQNKLVPVSNDKAKISVTLDMDYNADAKTALFDLQLAGTPTSLVCTAIGNAIGATGQKDTFSLNPTNLFVDTGGEAPLDGPEIVHNTINLTGTIDAAGDSALKGNLITADTGW
jgi:hypothetical protein